MKHTIKILSDLEQEKSKSGSQGKVAVQEISPRSIPMQGIKSILINVTENELKHKGLTKMLTDGHYFAIRPIISNLKCVFKSFTMHVYYDVFI